MAKRLPYFRTYDVRGTFPDEVNADLAYKLGRAVMVWSGAREVIVGRDARLSSPSLAEALIDGLRAGGATVLDVGLATTPMLNFAVARWRRYGLMVTASHNPKEYNGVKVIDPGVEQVYYGRGLERLEELVVMQRFQAGARRGGLRLRTILPDYESAFAARFRDSVRAAPPLVVDCSNGVGGLPLGALEALGIAYTPLYHVPNGEFPNHGCDTLRAENLRDLQRAVTQQGAGLGVMFDGDADRVAFVDERGEIGRLDYVFVLLARQALAGGGGRVFYDLRFSHAVKEEIEKQGGTAVTLRVGNPFHKEALHRHDDALLAAELSGHIMYREHFGIDDPLYATLKLLALLAQAGRGLAELLRTVPHYPGSGELRIETRDPAALVEKARAQFADAAVNTIDGITVEYSDWWFNLRPSNTEPVAKLVIEAALPEQLARRQRELLALFAGGEVG